MGTIGDRPQLNNVGALEGTINGMPANQLSSNAKWLSGDGTRTPLTEAPIWSAQIATGKGGASWLRDTAAEYRMLNDIAQKLEPNATVGDVYTSHSGEVKIVRNRGQTPINPYGIIGDNWGQTPIKQCWSIRGHY